MAPSSPILARFNEWHIVNGDGCWQWSGSLTPDGYAKLTHDYKTVRKRRARLRQKLPC